MLRIANVSLDGGSIVSCTGTGTGAGPGTGTGPSTGTVTVVHDDDHVHDTVLETLVDETTRLQCTSSWPRWKHP